MIKNTQPGLLVKSGNSFALTAYVPLRDSDGNGDGFMRPGGLGLIIATRGPDVLLLWQDGLAWVTRTILVQA